MAASVQSWSGAGLVTGPGAWAVNQMLSYTLVPWVCAGGKVDVIPVVALAAAAVALVGALISWRALRRRDDRSPEATAGRPYDLLAGMGILIALLFALAILMQGAAGFVFHGCER